MTRTTVTTVLVSLAAMLSLAGCGGGGLTAGGHAHVSSAGATSGFDFPDGVRLDGGAGTTTGSCQISRGASGVYGVVIDLYGNAQGQGRAVRSVTIMGQSQSPASGDITADLGGDEFTSSASCVVDVRVVDENRGDVQVRTTSCELTFGTETATTDVDLSLSGCTVI